MTSDNMTYFWAYYVMVSLLRNDELITLWISILTNSYIL